MIKAVIFDLDGTILDSEPITSQSYKLLLESYDKTPIPKFHSLLHTVGTRGNEIWKELKEKYNIIEDVEVLREKRRAHHVSLLQRELYPLPGVVQLLQLLREKKIKIALATGSSPIIVDIVLEKLHIKKYFYVILHGWDFKKNKPHPKPFLLAGKKKGNSTKNFICI